MREVRSSGEGRMHGPGAKVAMAVIAGAIAIGLAVPAAVALEVVVTIKPLHALVARVMADTAATPHLLVQGGLSAHTYALKPSDAARLSQADVFIRMSDTMEPFTAKVIKSLPGRVQVVTLEDTKGLLLLERRS